MKNIYICIACILILCMFGITSNAQIQTNAVNGDCNFSDEQTIKLLLDEFFTINNGSLKGRINNDVSLYLDNNRNKSYILDKSVYLKELMKRSNINILWDETNVNVIDMQVTEDKAIVNIYEEYKYQEENATDISSTGTQYVVELNKKDNVWKIIDMTSNDEFDSIYKYKDFDLSKALKNIESIPKSDKEIEEINKKETENINKARDISILSSWVFTSYDRGAAKTYALNHSDTTYDSTVSTSYNDLFIEYTPNDCANFGSQSVFAGFGGDYDNATAINNKSHPMISTGNRLWWATDSTSSYNSDYGNGWNWANCVAFGEYIADGGHQIEGLNGWIHEGTVMYAYPGDIIQIRSGTSGDDWYHTYVVTSVTGTQGILTPNDIYICSHTTNLHNIKLSTRCSNEGRLRVLRIGTHYSYQ